MKPGRRVFISDSLRTVSLATGDYTQRHGDWWAVLPNDQFVRLTDHAVTEHDGGRITVDGTIHGAFALVRGVWTEAA